jgi:hypothetical protein
MQQTPAVPSPVARRAVAAFHMATFFDDLAASVLAARVARYRESLGVDTDEYEAITLCATGCNVTATCDGLCFGCYARARIAARCNSPEAA